MKTLIFLSLAICSSLSSICHAQWQPDARLTNDPANSETSTNAQRSVASNGDFVHIVWDDSRDGNYEIYYKRSTDGGSSWGADTRLTNNVGDSRIPSVTVSGSVVHVVWADASNLNYEIYYKRSTDGGVSWGADTRLTNQPGNYSFYPVVSASGQVVHVVWQYTSDYVNFELYYKRSTDGGSSWGPNTRLNDSTSSLRPSVTVSGQVVHLVWHDGRDGNYEIYYKRSTDGGSSWGADTRLTYNAYSSQYPSVSVSGQAVHVVWEEHRDGNYEIYYKRSTDGGSSWGADTRLTNDTSGSLYPSVSVSGQVVHVVWYDGRDGNYEIYYKRSTDGGSSWGADKRLTRNSAVSEFPSVSVSDQAVHVVWSDNRDGNYEIYYKRNPTGNPLGIININSEVPKEFSLSQNYPNPFNPTTKIRFALPKSSFAKLVVYDILGREVETIVNEYLYAGTYEADWNATNFPSGVYYYMLSSGEFSETKRAVLMK